MKLFVCFVGCAGGDFLPDIFDPYSVLETFAENEYIGLEDRIAATEFSTVFHTNHPGVVIKYQVHCHGSSEHPLVREYLFLKKVAILEIAPVPFYLSPAVEIGQASVSAKTAFYITPTDYAKCHELGGTVRFLLMSELGSSLLSLRTQSGPFPLLQTLDIAIRGFESLAVLHSRGILHGDVHWGNLSWEGDGVKFFDFGRSDFAPTNVETTARTGFVSDPMFSHWEMEGKRSSFRDDAFRFLITIAMLMNDDDFNMWFRAPTAFPSAQAHHEFKRDGFIFDRPITRLPQTVPPDLAPLQDDEFLDDSEDDWSFFVSGARDSEPARISTVEYPSVWDTYFLDPYVQSSVKDLFGEVLNMVRATLGDALPNYPGILETLTLCKRIVEDCPQDGIGWLLTA